jgi:hypothetical protein
MALNFGLLNQGGPTNFFEGYSQGQEKMQANAMAQQKADQAQQEFGMRQQEFAAGQADKQRVAKAAVVTQGLAFYKDALLRSKDPAAARRVVQMQYADPDIGPIRSRLGPLEQALAEVPDEPTAFQKYLEDEAMGLDAVLKQRASTREFATAMGGAPQAMPQANAMAPAAPAPMANAMVAPAVSGELQNYLGQRERLTALANQTPQVAATINRLDKEIARLSPAAGAPSPLARLQSELAAMPPNDPRRADYLAAIKKETQFAPPASTNVTMVSERAEQGARGKMLVDQYSDIAKAAGLAARTLPSIEVNLSALNKGFDTGFGKETIAAGASVLASLGVPEAAKFATDTQKFQSNAISAVLQKQLEQKGPQTESDARRIEQIGAQLGKTKQANEFILSMAGELLRRDIDQRNFYDRWYKTNKTYDGAENAWFGGEGGKSLFDRPGLKKYSAPAPAAAGGLSSAEQAELDQLRKQVGGKK